MIKRLYLLLMAISVSITVLAIDLDKYPLLQDKKPRTVSPYIKADIDNRIITIDIKRYHGAITIYTKTQDGACMDFRETYSNVSLTLTIDASNYERNRYTLYIITDDATYYGDFEISQ